MEIKETLEGMMTDNNKTFIRYRLTWKPDLERTRKEAYIDSQEISVNTEWQRFFASLDMAELWYKEKLAEGKKPQLWKEETTTILYKLK